MLARAFAVQIRRCDAEVEQLHFAGIGQTHVGRIDIAMNQIQTLEVVRIGQPARDLGHDMDRHGNREHASLRGHLLEQRRNVVPLDELLHEEDLALDLADVVRVGQIAVNQLARQIGLVPEVTHMIRLQRKRGQKPLDHAQGFELAVPRHGQVHRPHAALTEWLQ